MNNAKTPKVEISVDTDDCGATFDVSIFAVGDVDPEPYCLACFSPDHGETVADAAEDAVSHLEACASEARRQFEVAGILMPKATDGNSSPNAPRGFIDWHTTAQKLSDRLYDIRARLEARLGETTEDAASRAVNDATAGAVHRAHRASSEQTIATLVDENNRLARRVRNRDAQIQALRNALGSWRGTGASEHTSDTHRVTETFMRPLGKELVVAVTWVSETETEK